MVMPATVIGNPASDRNDAGHIVALRIVRLAAAHDDVLDLAGIEFRHLAQYVPDAMSSQLIGTRDIEGTSERLSQSGAGTGNDHGLSHVVFRRQARRRALY